MSSTFSTNSWLSRVHSTDQSTREFNNWNIISNAGAAIQYYESSWQSMWASLSLKVWTYSLQKRTFFADLVRHFFSSLTLALNSLWIKSFRTSGKFAQRCGEDGKWHGENDGICISELFFDILPKRSSRIMYKQILSLHRISHAEINLPAESDCWTSCESGSSWS